MIPDTGALNYYMHTFPDKIEGCPMVLHMTRYNCLDAMITINRIAIITIHRVAIITIHRIALMIIYDCLDAGFETLGVIVCELRL